MRQPLDDIGDLTPRWLPPPTELSLNPDAVHLWRAGLDVPPDDVRRLGRVLARDEAARAWRIQSDRARDRFIVGRGILRMILGRYLRLEPEQVQLACSPQGKPHLASSLSGSRLSFNMTHSGGLALVAIALGREVGVDVEYVRPLADAQAIADGYFSEQECDALRALPETEKQARFFATWTRKEARLKAMAVGLGGWLSRFAESLVPSEAAWQPRATEDPAEAARWSLVSFSPLPGSIATLAVEGHGWELVCWDFAR